MSDYALSVSTAAVGEFIYFFPSLSLAPCIIIYWEASWAVKLKIDRSGRAQIYLSSAQSRGINKNFHTFRD